MEYPKHFTDAAGPRIVIKFAHLPLLQSTANFQCTNFTRSMAVHHRPEAVCICFHEDATSGIATAIGARRQGVWWKVRLKMQVSIRTVNGPQGLTMGLDFVLRIARNPLELCK